MNERVLVVDDEPMICEILTRVLACSGFQCVTANDGKVAAELLQKRTLDVVIIDLVMPGTDGQTLASDLLKSAKRPYIIVHSAIDARGSFAI